MREHVEIALLEAVAVRDAVFALGDADLVLMAEALLHGIALAAHRPRGGALDERRRMATAA